MNRGKNSNTVLSPPHVRFDMRYIPEPNSGCWIWLGGVNKATGYAEFYISKERKVLGHRFSYEWNVGPISPELQVDHKCRVRCCVNPDHLQLVSCRENILLGETLAAANAAKTHCPKGHEYSAQNVMITIDGYRRCRECSRQDVRRRRAKQRRR